MVFGIRYCYINRRFTKFQDQQSFTGVALLDATYKITSCRHIVRKRIFRTNLSTDIYNRTFAWKICIA